MMRRRRHTHLSHLKFTTSVSKASSSRSLWLYSFLGMGGRCTTCKQVISEQVISEQSSS